MHKRSHLITLYFFHGNFVPISVNAENTRYIISSPALIRKITTSLFIGKVVESSDNSRLAIA
ncbi:hypothetical protein ACN23B_28785 (plasmid) [Anabaena sp. FACHB-709]|uniref:Uncharacterized protein n=1 Tax=Anabaena cylindrica FACHB-318 TaxID=2692880 RepID=A0ABR7ZSH5_ANACY|nr:MULTISPECIES: hypothetical protein [Nostocaceae]MBD2175277.1 hypothetical protein [Anabaena cylindrica FACHB-318]MBD2267173.1 hypothetical protein [Anabaena sp. FACHB-709]MBD2276733.1 hypothetical protein [Nostoc sp. PCC 7120 = FACHB-418]MBD2287281.1 hypothetical protein [Anabaena cylindrica FACHB-170]